MASPGAPSPPSPPHPPSPVSRLALAFFHPPPPPDTRRPQAPGAAAATASSSQRQSWRLQPAAATRRGLSALLLSSRALPRRLRPLAAASAHLAPWALPLPGAKTASSGGSGYSPLNDPSPHWSNRPPKETILLDGCDYEHWLIVMEFPTDPKPSEEEMVAAYVKTLASVLGRPLSTQVPSPLGYEFSSATRVISVQPRAFFSVGLSSWKSKIQIAVSYSNDEVALTALATTLSEIDRLRWLLAYLGV